jgi:hypothetical protein
MEKEQKSKLVEKYKSGQVSATIFSSEVTKDKKTYTQYSVKVVKSYTLDDGKTWKETNNYNKDDLVKLQLVISKATEFLYLNEKQ